MKGVSNYKLKVYKEVAELLSFTDAAISLGVSQATVSKILLDLEEEFGEVLMKRTTASVELTPAGKIVLKYALDALYLEDKTRFELILLDEEMSGSISLGVEGRDLYLTVSGILEKFEAIFERIDFRVVIDTGDKLMEELNRGELDILLMKGSINEHYTNDSSLNGNYLLNASSLNDSLLIEHINRESVMITRKNERAPYLNSFVNYILKLKM